MGERALLDGCARAPALTVNHLFIRQNRVVHRIPVNNALAPVNEASLQKVEKHGLFVAVIRRVASGKFARPVKRKAQRFQLRAHRVDIFISPGRRMRALFNRGIFRRHAKRVPPHRVQHIISLGYFEAGNHIAHGIIADMAHVNAARWIGKHFQHIIFRFAAVRAQRLEAVSGLPCGLPVAFAYRRIIA